VLGCVDIGEPDSLDAALPAAHLDASGVEEWESDAPAHDEAAVLPEQRAAASVGAGRILRITPRGRSYLAGLAPEARRESAFRDNQVLRIGENASVARVLALVPFVEIGRVDEQLDVLITPSTLSNALAAGLDAAAIRQRLEALAPLPEPVSRALVQASAVLGRAQYVSTAGFLWVDDPELRELLRTRRQTADLFLEPSPPGGLLLAPGVDLERVTLRCRTLGVEVVTEKESRSMALSSKAAAVPQPDSENRARSAMRRPSGTRRKESAPGSRRIA
jgi:hypothetical protein